VFLLKFKNKSFFTFGYESFLLFTTVLLSSYFLSRDKKACIAAGFLIVLNNLRKSI
jgi:hypothetical protein